MASTQGSGSGGTTPGSRYQKRFVAVATPEGDDETIVDEEQSEEATSDDDVYNRPLMSPRAAISGVVMIALAAIVFVVGAVFGGSEPTLSDDTKRTALSLNERITTAQKRADALPKADEVNDALSQVQIAANQVAGLQNDYRMLTPAAAKAGALDDNSVTSSLRTLVPLFSPEVKQAELRPWYLLAADAAVPTGTGLPMGFDSGFKWIAQVPYGIESDSTIDVTWLAVQTRTAKGAEPAMLAWARASYDMKRGTFSDVSQGVTTTGEGLKLEVDGL